MDETAAVVLLMGVVIVVSSPVPFLATGSIEIAFGHAAAGLIVVMTAMFANTVQYISERRGWDLG